MISFKNFSTGQFSCQPPR